MPKAKMDTAAKYAAVLFHDSEDDGSFKTEYEYEIIRQIRHDEDVRAALANIRRI